MQLFPGKERRFRRSTRSTTVTNRRYSLPSSQPAARSTVRSMLVLSRKLDQSLRLGDEITITVLGIDGDRVKIGIDAPRSIPVLRAEVYLQVQTPSTAMPAPTSRP